MLFPIGDDQVRGGAKPFFSYLLLGLNIVVFLLQFSMGEDANNAFIFTYGAIPQFVTQGDRLYSLFTSMFLHGGWLHLAGNMVFLWVFADNIEAIVGNFRFILFYLAGGLAAMLAQCFLSPTSNIPCVGASGAIAAVLGAYLMMFPSSKIKVWALFIFTLHWPAILFLGIWILQQLFNGYVAMQDTQSGSNGGVAWWAHIGGFFFGLLVGFVFRPLIGYYLNEDGSTGYATLGQTSIPLPNQTPNDNPEQHML